MIGSTTSSSTGISSILVEIQSRTIADSINRKKSSSGNSQTKSDSTSQTGQSKSSAKSEITAATELTNSEKSEVRQLKNRDAEVRAHEQAHIRTGGSLIRGGASYEYTTGPDNKRYAIGGEVGIDTSPVKNDPEATIIKGQHIKRTALAPREPSSQDYAVASKAQRMITAAQMELARMNREGMQSDSEDNKSTIPQMKVAQAYQPAGETTSAGFDLNG